MVSSTSSPLPNNVYPIPMQQNDSTIMQGNKKKKKKKKRKKKEKKDRNIKINGRRLTGMGKGKEKRGGEREIRK